MLDARGALARIGVPEGLHVVGAHGDERDWRHRTCDDGVERFRGGTRNRRQVAPRQHSIGCQDADRVCISSHGADDVVAYPQAYSELTRLRQASYAPSLRVRDSKLTVGDLDGERHSVVSHTTIISNAPNGTSVRS